MVLNATVARSGLTGIGSMTETTVTIPAAATHASRFLLVTGQDIDTDDMKQKLWWRPIRVGIRETVGGKRVLIQTSLDYSLTGEVLLGIG